MANENQTADACGKKFDILYQGHYIAVADHGRPALVAHAFDDEPEMDEKEYLLRMVDELLAVYDKILRDGERRVIHVGATLRRGCMKYALAVDKNGNVQVMPLEDDYEDFINTAEKVEMKVVGRDIINDFRASYGRYAVMVEDKEGSLHAFGRDDVKLRPERFMLAVIREVMYDFEDVKELRDVEAVTVHGSVRRDGAAFFPVVHRGFRVEFVWEGGDYMDFVRGAERIRFVWWGR